MKSFVATMAPQASLHVPVTCEIASKKSRKEKPNCARTRIERKIVPPISRTALMICTQVVASMPPKTT